MHPTIMNSVATLVITHPETPEAYATLDAIREAGFTTLQAVRDGAPNFFESILGVTISGGVTSTMTVGEEEDVTTIVGTLSVKMARTVVQVGGQPVSAGPVGLARMLLAAMTAAVGDAEGFEVVGTPSGTLEATGEFTAAP